jgi:hypothetical protein
MFIGVQAITNKMQFYIEITFGRSKVLSLKRQFCVKFEVLALVTMKKTTKGQQKSCRAITNNNNDNDNDSDTSPESLEQVLKQKMVRRKLNIALICLRYYPCKHVLSLKKINKKQISS